MKGKSRKRIKVYLTIVPLFFLILLLFSVFVVPPPSRVIVIGVDAAEWDVIYELVDAGRLPNFKRVIDGGVTSKLETIEPSISAAIWTTISTGAKPQVHGIRDFVIPDSKNHPYNSGMRKVPAMWNIASHYGRRVGIVGHWVTWPAEKVNGHLVSNFLSFGPEEAPLLQYKGEEHKISNLSNKTYPEELTQELDPLLLTLDEVTHEDLDPFFEIEDWENPALYKNTLDKALNYLVPFYYAADVTNFGIFYHLWKNEGPYDLMYTYIESTDTNAHRFWQFRDTEYLDEVIEQWGYDPQNRELYVNAFEDTLNRFYEWTDQRIGMVLDDMEPRDTLVIVSDHGFGAYTESEVGYSDDNEGHTFSGSHTHFGVLMLYGANVKKGYRIKGQKSPRVIDVLPTILTLMKIPVSKQLDGFVIWDAMDEAFKATYKGCRVRSYGIENQFGLQDRKTPYDEELVERMRSLGYLQGTS